MNMFENPLGMNLDEVQEGLREADESAALELSAEGAEAMETGMPEETDDADAAEGTAVPLDSLDAIGDMDTMMDALQLTDAEKASFREVGKTLQDLPVANGIKGYKKGNCNDRLIPIYS